MRDEEEERRRRRKKKKKKKEEERKIIKLKFHVFFSQLLSGTAELLG